ncbi:hypothetical protein GCM10018787_31580 [Streptomyces thermodiastaticus]|nr:hypothetical protein GCM10018787_31580 [Streptomyces thermodiastaticus]
MALLPQVIAGTLALLRTVICSMSLPTRTSPPGPGEANPIAPQGHAGIAPPGFTCDARGLTATLRIGLRERGVDEPLVAGGGAVRRRAADHGV